MNPGLLTTLYLVHFLTGLCIRHPGYSENPFSLFFFYGFCLLFCFVGSFVLFCTLSSLSSYCSYKVHNKQSSVDKHADHCDNRMLGLVRVRKYSRSLCLEQYVFLDAVELLQYHSTVHSCSTYTQLTNCLGPKGHR